MSKYTDKCDVEDLLRAANLVRMVAIRRESPALHGVAGIIMRASAATLDPDEAVRRDGDSSATKKKDVPFTGTEL